jgi:hypothetical protein
MAEGSLSSFSRRGYGTENGSSTKKMPKKQWPLAKAFPAFFYKR